LKIPKTSFSGFKALLFQLGQLEYVDIQSKANSIILSSNGCVEPLWLLGSQAADPEWPWRLNLIQSLMENAMQWWKLSLQERWLVMTREGDEQALLRASVVGSLIIISLYRIKNRTYQKERGFYA
jgi:hypothetical protein